MCLTPAALVFLTIDRCWIIIVGIISQRKQAVFTAIAIIISISSGLLIGWGYGKDPPASVITDCPTFGCIADRSGYNIFITFKMVAGGCNFIAGVIFILLWKSKRKSVSNGLYFTAIEEKKRRAVSLRHLSV